MFLVSNAKTAAALQNELTLINLGDKVFSTVSWAEATLMIRCAATLAKDQGPLYRIILVVTAGIAASKMALPEFVIIRNDTKGLSGSSVLLLLRSAT